MFVKIVDKWRGVTHSAQPVSRKDDPFGVLGDMTKGYVGNLQAEIVCDKEFMDALAAQALKDPHCKIVPAEESGRSTRTPTGIVNHPTFDNIPIVVTE